MTKNIFENLNQKQFEYILEVLISYKQTNPNMEVTLSERSFKEAVEQANNIKDSLNL
jgi:hypothetical protein